MKCSSSKTKNQHLTLNLTPLKQNFLFASSSAPRVEFYYIIFSLIKDVTNTGNGERGTGNREWESGN